MKLSYQFYNFRITQFQQLQATCANQCQNFAFKIIVLIWTPMPHRIFFVSGMHVLCVGPIIITFSRNILLLPLFQ